METADHIMRTRTVKATTVLAGQADLRNYPFRLLAVESISETPTLYAAAEHLSNYGWDLVNVYCYGTNVNIVHAVMRRAL